MATPKRTDVVNKVNSWEGWNETNGKYKQIIDIYNAYRPGMLYSWPWCACCASAAFIAVGATADDMPVEISCPRMVTLAQKNTNGNFSWVEDDATVPEIGWLVLYDWDDNGVGDNKGNPDHVGIVTYVNKAAGYFVVTEGNYSDSVKKRTVSINGRYIRGFVKIKFSDSASQAITTVTNTQRDSGKDVATVAREVISGLWGTGAARKINLEKAGYNYSEVQAKVNAILNGSAPTGTVSSQKAPTESKVTSTCYARYKDAKIAGTYKTTSKLYMRNDAGTDKKALCQLPKGATVHCYGFYNLYGGVKWLYVTASLNGVQYTGFCSSEYLKK